MENKPEVKRRFGVVEASLVGKNSQLYCSRKALVFMVGWSREGMGYPEEVGPASKGK